ncbi:hypothetical protein [Amycolatopsis vastitatis]|uniref:Uncharacterized protein n=1 Tax=Amycolatopsis vastitatis TaxID=1905142 RepID=A0A229T213_9PSEU|nr:hypothetical protein [Amycolatopsis vastitatis]OXM65315.1 hypothetical protein CF165_23585 [Amycolatopsis vastitatis]
MSDDQLPDRESLLEALQLIGRGPNLAPLDTASLEHAQPAVLIGILDAAIHTLAEQYCKGKGTSQRFQIVKGYKLYLGARATEHDVMQFFQSRVKRLGADMQSALNEVP